MTPQEVVDFVRGNPVTVRLVYPEVGWLQTAYRVFGAISDGQRLCFIGEGNQYSLFGAYALSITRTADQVTIKTKDRPTKMVVLTRIPNEDVRALRDYKQALDAYDEAIDDDDLVAARMRETLASLSEPSSSKTYALDYVRWGEFDGEGVSPRGIVMRTADGTKLTAIPFPGYEREAGRWMAWESIGPNVLHELPALAGMETIISGPMAILGADWDDASNIALFAFGADYYMSTGRSLFA